MSAFAKNFLGLAAALVTASCSPGNKSDPATAPSSAAIDHADPIKSAMSAAPSAVAEKAAIVVANDDGTMKTLRAGSNGFTCMPDSPATPGPDPMCMDANAMKWAEAWVGHKPPPTDAPGVMYMLAGGTDASNTDPYAKAPTAGGDWIKTGPHLMVVGSAKALANYPSGPKPDTHAPYVMWAGTPYAHLMIPVS
ncbi:hypothetical protein KRR38_33170 [Novosphingobium sp. G106]|uniref:hypothetical protein n=1 Tax=Novosphingobium sp. G106 TaxID=2849500 RepID=UPI001C2D9E63|nr:hypothetical protein [Novosphingobium sp. G106]MBV1692372.1 hypothetical protein [Novosphingobium sp. G106]